MHRTKISDSAISKKWAERLQVSSSVTHGDFDALDHAAGPVLVMTPQLLQAIKLLQLSNLELVAFVEQELERNPLLERDDDGAAVAAEDRPVSDKEGEGDSDTDSFEATSAESLEGDWASETMVSDRESLEAQLEQKSKMHSTPISR